MREKSARECVFRACMRGRTNASSRTDTAEKLGVAANVIYESILEVVMFRCVCFSLPLAFRVCQKL